MKIYRLALLLFSGALTLGASGASASNLAPQQLVGKRRVQLRAPQAAHAPIPNKIAKNNRFKRLPNGQARSMGATPREVSHSAVLTKRGSTPSLTGVSPVHQPNLFPSSSASFVKLRHRGPNPAVIGGLGTSRTSEREAINGSLISRRP